MPRSLTRGFGYLEQLEKRLGESDMKNGNVDQAISALKDVLGDRLSTGESIREIHGRDEAYSEPALPDAVAFPESTQEVSQIMKICSQNQVPVVPFGIGTSLEGHVIPIHGGISVDTSRMNKVLQIRESDLDAVGSGPINMLDRPLAA